MTGLGIVALAAVLAAGPASDTLPPRHVIVVDAGHGGVDPGMRGAVVDGGVLVEKDVTLQFARALRDALLVRGIAVLMTRSTDTLVALADRGRLAARTRADAFLSIHVNAANPARRDAARVRGVETYFLSEARTDEARRVARIENAPTALDPAGTPEGDGLEFVLADMSQNEHLRESADLAELVQLALGRVHPGPSLGVKQAGFKVLVTAGTPAALVELGFGSNSHDARLLTDARWVRRLAGCVADAAAQYLSRRDRRVASASR